MDISITNWTTSKSRDYSSDDVGRYEGIYKFLDFSNDVRFVSFGKNHVFYLKVAEHRFEVTDMDCYKLKRFVKAENETYDIAIKENNTCL